MKLALTLMITAIGLAETPTPPAKHLPDLLKAELYKAASDYSNAKLGRDAAIRSAQETGDKAVASAEAIFKSKISEAEKACGGTIAELPDKEGKSQMADCAPPKEAPKEK